MKGLGLGLRFRIRIWVLIGETYQALCDVDEMSCSPK